MPCQNNFNASSFPTTFPANFEPDTSHFYQALAEYNYERVAAGLPTQNYFELGKAERHAVIALANALKFEARSKPIPLKPVPTEDTTVEPEALVLESELEYFSSVGCYLLVAGVSILIASLLHYL